MHGYGIMKMDIKVGEKSYTITYDGYFKENKFWGHGKLTCSQSEACYEGTWKNG